MSIDLRAAWNRVSGDYQAAHAIPSHSAHYGPWAPLENELRLLGDVRGLRILEVGCGGGQCSVAFAKQGALVAGIDLSDEQLAFARRLAEREGVAVEFFQGSAVNLGVFASGAWDVVFSAYAFQYVREMPRCLAECSRVLRPGGRLVFSLDHPFRDCFLDAEEDTMSIVPSRSYFDNSPQRWSWTLARASVPMESYHFTIAQWVEMLAGAGFRLVRLLEPAPPAEMVEEIWPADDALAALGLIPQTVIFVAEKVG
jgi:ubiquinone/menaquinone biosynthesis C-methylase UbiE